MTQRRHPGRLPEGIENINVLACDDIRHETSGKHILIGVYTGTLILAHEPQSLPLCFALSIYPNSDEKLKYEMECYLGENKNFSAELEFQANGNNMMFIPTPPIVFKDMQSGIDLVVRLGLKHDSKVEEMCEVFRMPIAHGENPNLDRPSEDGANSI